jgi:hypothetical protein
MYSMAVSTSEEYQIALLCLCGWSTGMNYPTDSQYRVYTDEV